MTDPIDDMLAALQSERAWLDSPARMNNLDQDVDLVRRVHALFAALWDEAKRDHAAATLVAFCKSAGWQPHELALVLPGGSYVEWAQARLSEAYDENQALRRENAELRAQLGVLNEISRKHYQSLREYRDRYKRR